MEIIPSYLIIVNGCKLGLIAVTRVYYRNLANRRIFLDNPPYSAFILKKPY